MKVGFLGAPGSGKTTVAAMLFARLKCEGVHAEYLPEAARSVIRALRARGKAMPDDHDQLAIMWMQHFEEASHMAGQGQGYVLVTDGCTANAMAYLAMGGDGLGLGRDQADHAAKMSAEYDVLFYSKPLDASLPEDPNRVHGGDLGAEFGSAVQELCVTGLIPEVVLLEGSQEKRLQTAYTAVRAAHSKLAAGK